MVQGYDRLQIALSQGLDDRAVMLYRLPIPLSLRGLDATPLDGKTMSVVSPRAR